MLLACERAWTSIQTRFRSCTAPVARAAEGFGTVSREVFGPTRSESGKKSAPVAFGLLASSVGRADVSPEIRPIAVLLFLDRIRQICQAGARAVVPE